MISRLASGWYDPVLIQEESRSPIVHILYIQQLLILPGCPGNDRSFEFARQWTRAGHRVTCLSSNAALPADSPWRTQSPAATQIEVEGITLHLLDVPYAHKMPFWRRVWAFLRFYRQALQLGKSLAGFDLVLAWSAPLSAGELGRKLAAFHGVPFVFEVADVWPDVPIGMGIIRNPWLIRWLHRRTHRMYRDAALILPFSEGMRDQIAAHSVPPSKITVIHNGANLQKFPYIDRRRNKPYVEVLYAGTVGKANGLTQLVAAAARIHELGRTDIRFTLLGSGNDLPAVQRAAQRAGIDNIRFLEAVPRETVAQLLAEADIGIVSFAPFPVLEANGATKFFDYLASGLPLLLNYQGWQAGYLAQYSCGLSSPQGDLDAFVSNLLRLADDPELRRQMGANGRKLAAELFDREVLAQRMLANMQHIADLDRGEK